MRILLASSDPVLVELLTALLHPAGVTIDCACDTVGFVALVSRRGYSVVVTDFVAPFLNGSLLRRALDRYSHTYLCLLSSVADERLVVELYKAGIDCYMTFPINLGRLRRLVCDQLKRAALC